jgi:hypothetical protein
MLLSEVTRKGSSMQSLKRTKKDPILLVKKGILLLEPQPSPLKALYSVQPVPRRPLV